MSRDDLPTPIRQDLDLQRKNFVRWVGSEYEKLLEANIDPTLWVQAVVQELHNVYSDLDEAA